MKNQSNVGNVKTQILWIMVEKDFCTQQIMPDI